MTRPELVGVCDVGVGSVERSSGASISGFAARTDGVGALAGRCGRFVCARGMDVGWDEDTLMDDDPIVRGVPAWVEAVADVRAVPVLSQRGSQHGWLPASGGS